MTYLPKKLYQSFENLEIWQLGNSLVLKTYTLTKLFPKEELFGLTNQLRRAMVSVPANIAEGYGRKSKKEFSQFLVISLGSLEEVRYYFLLAVELKYISISDRDNMVDRINELKGKLNAFRNSLLKPNT